MNTPNTSLSKICSNCGQRKPLSAFLQLAGSHGYGNICSSCRKTVLAKEPEDNTRSTTGAKIDAKLKVKDAADKREAFKQQEEEYFDGRKKREEKRVNQIEKVGDKTESEKKHRSFMGSFLDSQKKTSAPTTPVSGGEQNRAPGGKADFTHGIAATENARSSVFNTFINWLPAGSALGGVAQKLAQQKKADSKAPAPSDATDKISEYVHKNSGPKSGR